MSPLTGFYAKVGAGGLVVFALAYGFYGAYCHGKSVADARWEAEWAKHSASQANGVASATIVNRAEEQRRQSAVNQVGSDAGEKIVSAVADGTAADAAGERVREQAGKFAAGASCPPSDTGAARRSASATSAALVLSDMFQRADKRAGELAKAYDRARIAGQSCERAYDSLRGDPK